MDRCFLAAMLIACLSAPHFAQPHPGGILMGGGFPNGGSSYLPGTYTADKTSGALSVVWNLATPGSMTYRPYYWNDTTMGFDNASYVYCTGGTTSSVYTQAFGAFTYDPATRQTTTLAQSSSQFRWCYGIEKTQNRTYYLLGRSGVRDIGIYEITSPGVWRTVAAQGALSTFSGAVYPLLKDLSTGDFLVHTQGGAGGIGNPVFTLAQNGTWGTWNYTADGGNPTYGASYDIANDEVIYVSDSSVYTVSRTARRSRIAVLTLLHPGLISRGSVLENQSVTNPRLIVSASSNTKSELVWYDRNTNTVTKTTTVSATGPGPYVFSEIMHDRADYLIPQASGPLRWDVEVHVPARASKPYAVVPSISGITPGMSVDTRRIWLNIDPISFGAALNLLGAVWQRGQGRLDPNGKATVTCDLSGLNLPPSQRFNIHMVLGILDAAAPSGLDFISEPACIQVRT